MPPLTVIPQVVDAGEVPARAAQDGSLGERPTVGPGTGFDRLEQTVIECAPGVRARRASGAAEEVLFVLQGSGTLELAGASHALEPESGAYLAPDEEYELRNTGSEPLKIVAVRIPAPEPPAPEREEAEPVPPGKAGPRAVVRRLADQEAEAATTDREFRIVADPDSGLKSATHFVGYIPAARAPEHFHTYDEVIYVLDGEGVFHAGGSHRQLRPGSCIQLPARTVHCLQNTGGGVMRVLGVFRPAGSPAAAYYPDGTPAYGGAPPLADE